MHPRKIFEKRSPIKRSPVVVGHERNDFGTRLCQRIECSRCHKVDYVAKKIAQAKIIYCRACAERLLETFEAGRVIAEAKVIRKCGQCNKEFAISEAVASKKEELRCQDCFRGFDVWRGKIRASSPNKDVRSLSLAHGAKTIVRKNTNDAI